MAAVDSIILDAQSNLQSASEITGALSNSFADAVSTVLIKGDAVGEKELMEELEEMLMAEEEGGEGNAAAHRQNYHQDLQQPEKGWGTLRAGEEEEMAIMEELHKLPAPPAQKPHVAARRTLPPPPPSPSRDAAAAASKNRSEDEDVATGRAYASPFLSVPLQSARRKMVAE